MTTLRYSDYHPKTNQTYKNRKQRETAPAAEEPPIPSPPHSPFGAFQVHDIFTTFRQCKSITNMLHV